MVTIVNMRTRSEVEGLVPQTPYSLPFASGGLIGNQYTPRYEDYVALMRGSVIGRKAAKGDKKKNPAAAAGATRFGTPATSAGQIGTNPDAARETRIAGLKLQLQNLQDALHSGGSSTGIPALMACMQSVVTELDSLGADKVEQSAPATPADPEVAKKARIAGLKLELQNLQCELDYNNSSTDVSVLMERMQAVVTELDALSVKKTEQPAPSTSADPEAARKARIAELELERQNLQDEYHTLMARIPILVVEFFSPYSPYFGAEESEQSTLVTPVEEAVIKSRTASLELENLDEKTHILRTRMQAVVTELDALGAEKAEQSAPVTSADPETAKKARIAELKLELQNLQDELHNNNSSTDIPTLMERMQAVVTELDSLGAKGDE